MKRTLFSSNPMPRRILAAVCGAALLAGSSLGALAQSVGVHFGNAGGTGYATNSSTDLLLPTDSAGVPDYAQTNWNDLGASGDSGGVNGTPVVLTNSAGAATSLSIMWSSAGVGSTGTGSGLGTPDGNLMDGYLYSYSPGEATPLGNSVYYNSPTNNPLAYVGGLNAWCQAQGAVGYNVVLYTTGNSYWETVEGYLESVTGSPFSFSMVEGSVLTPPLYEQDSANYSGTYVPVTSTNSSSPTAGGNCMVFSGMTNDAVLIRVQTSGYGAGLNGFQIVPIYAPLPSVGVHFGNAGGTGYATNSSTDLLLPTDSAGVPDYAQTNWNDLGASGDSGGVNGTPVVLTNSAGAATSLSIMWDSAGVGSSGTGTGLGTPDGNLMDGYLTTWDAAAATPLGSSVYYQSANDNPLAYVGGLNAWCQAQGAIGYNVVLYTTGGSSYEEAEGYLESVTGSPFSWTMVEGSVLTPPLIDVYSATYSGTYVPVTSTNSGSPTYGGNYMVFTGLTNDAVLIRFQFLSSYGGAGLNGFQIMPIPGPTTSVVTLSSMVSGSSMTLSWPQGTLQTATNLLGPWTSSSATSPYTDTMTNAAQFYRVQVR